MSKWLQPVTENEKSRIPILRQCIFVVPAGVMLWPQNTRHATLTCRRFIVKRRAFSRSRPREAKLPLSKCKNNDVLFGISLHLRPHDVDSNFRSVVGASGLRPRNSVGNIPTVFVRLGKLRMKTYSVNRACPVSHPMPSHPRLVDLLGCSRA